ncbi:hypothetical protein ACIQM3_10530 [Streptomyces sp. NPDC091271]|uniref:hypothetical protein n=1 Tax=Streptomyces sp. NPDC091271 TaxID=3365980 RepID=UPI0037F95BC9
MIEPSDGAVLAGLLARNRQAYARRLPARPADFYTSEGQAPVIESLLASHARGLAWPGVVVSDDTVIGQVTISSILGGRRDYVREGAPTVLRLKLPAGRFTAHLLTGDPNTFDRTLIVRVDGAERARGEQLDGREFT